MQKLRESIGTGPERQKLIEDACKVLDQEVADKGGLTGLAIKSAYKLVSSIRPGFVRQVVDHLLDDFLDGIQPIYEEAVAGGRRPGALLVQEKSRVADALLAVTDRRADKADNGLIKSSYRKLRPAAKRHVEAAAPRLAELLDRHAPHA